MANDPANMQERFVPAAWGRSTWELERSEWFAHAAAVLQAKIRRKVIQKKLLANESWRQEPEYWSGVWAGDGNFFVDNFRTECSEYGTLNSYIISRDIRLRSRTEEHCREFKLYEYYPDDWFRLAENTPGTYEMKFEIQQVGLQKTLKIYFGCVKIHNKIHNSDVNDPNVDPNVTSVPYRQIAHYGGQPTKIGFIDWLDWSGEDFLLSPASHETPVGVHDLPQLQIYRKFRAGDAIVVEHNVVNEYNREDDDDEEVLEVLAHHRWESVYSLVPNGAPETVQGWQRRIYDPRNWRMYFPPDQFTKAVKWVNEQLKKPCVQRPSTTFC